jgi:hypothetical protein
LLSLKMTSDESDNAMASNEQRSAEYTEAASPASTRLS